MVRKGWWHGHKRPVYYVPAKAGRAEVVRQIADLEYRGVSELCVVCACVCYAASDVCQGVCVVW